MVFFQSLLQTIRPPLLLIILGHLPYIPLVSNAIPVWTILLDYEILHVPFATVLVPPWLVVRVILSILWQYRVLSPLHISGRRTRSDEDVGRSLLFVICSGARTTVTWCWGLIVVLYLLYSRSFIVASTVVSSYLTLPQNLSYQVTWNWISPSFLTGF